MHVYMLVYNSTHHGSYVASWYVHIDPQVMAWLPFKAKRHRTQVQHWRCRAVAAAFRRKQWEVLVGMKLDKITAEMSP